jgi:hypothetical protein
MSFSVAGAPDANEAIGVIMSCDRYGATGEWEKGSNTNEHVN